MTWASAFNVAGLLMNLADVILLFRYGMPYRVRTGGNRVNFISNKVDQATVKEERRYARFGVLGLALIIWAPPLRSPRHF